MCLIQSLQQNSLIRPFWYELSNKPTPPCISQSAGSHVRSITTARTSHAHPALMSREERQNKWRLFGSCKAIKQRQKHHGCSPKRNSFTTTETRFSAEIRTASWKWSDKLFWSYLVSILSVIQKVTCLMSYEVTARIYSSKWMFMTNVLSLQSTDSEVSRLLEELFLKDQAVQQLHQEKNHLVELSQVRAHWVLFREDMSVLDGGHQSCNTCVVCTMQKTSPHL